ncbi:hypothetical protein SAMN05661008_01643 [Alkalithermobacter thermoalcaliphilus JW-YL-7 = DSM 7308]|uniref:Uncharacterized protein n=1 Tax=Alkalithermobacter thermoalcaliphilus JW-YL-7 = DSM 7308 TaxID=1121328 RepID=A0A150FSP3_CLOPD|nr:hypothetical protein JWYL7_1697 [[Clostridium] paradoxum JW-YL-7 = DSM 7308]SHL19609.1 hypothetical protein SAMN05661008_01643 [[Clostridium] paradoxum JW-YL-7 = DSM 7308]
MAKKNKNKQTRIEKVAKLRSNERNLEFAKELGAYDIDKEENVIQHGKQKGKKVISIRKQYEK